MYSAAIFIPRQVWPKIWAPFLKLLIQLSIEHRGSHLLRVNMHRHRTVVRVLMVGVFIELAFLKCPEDNGLFVRTKYVPALAPNLQMVDSRYNA